MSAAVITRIKPGEYESADWHIERKAEEDDNVNDRGMAIHPVTGHEYVPAPVLSWFVYHKPSGDLHDAYPTLREARRVVERLEAADARGFGELRP